MKKLTLSILILFFIVSCNKSENSNFTKFPIEYYLKGKRTKTEIPFRFGKLYLYDSLIIVTNTFDSKKFIHLYNRTEFKYLSSSATVGKGPGEISNPFQAVLDKQNQTIWCMDHGKRKIFKFPIDSILKNPEFLPSDYVLLPSEKRLIIQYRPYNNDLFSFLNNRPNALISFFNYKGNIIDSLNIPDKIELYQNYKELRFSDKILYIHNFHPSSDRLLISFRFSDIIKILDKKGNILRSIQGPDIINHDPFAQLKESTLAYFDVSSSLNYIFGLYQGTKRVIYKNEQMISNFPHNLFIFNWKLTPIARINFEYSVSSFAIDQINNRIVTFSPDFGDFVIYELPDF